MVLQYSLKFDDFLQHQLYMASKNKSVKKQRIKSLVVFSTSMLLLLFVLYDENKPLNVFLIIMVAVSIILYPFYLPYHYYNHYKKHINETHKNKIGIICTIKFQESYVELCDETGDTKVNYSNLESINEIKDYYFLKLKTGESIVFPKSRIENLEALKSTFATLSKENQLTNITELNWKWK